LFSSITVIFVTHAQQDTNHDNKISFDEAYILVLKLYIRINRKAPIQPPSYEQFKRYFKKANASHTRNLDKNEFCTLTVGLARRATARLVVHQITTLLIAPVLAMQLVNTLSKKIGLKKVWGKTEWVTHIFPTRIREIFNREEFFKLFFTVVFVTSLGNIVVGLLNTFFYMRQTDDDDKAGDF